MRVDIVEFHENIRQRLDCNTPELRSLILEDEDTCFHFGYKDDFHQVITLLEMRRSVNIKGLAHRVADTFLKMEGDL